MDIKNPDPKNLPDLISKISEAFLYSQEGDSIEKDFPQLYHSKNFQNLWMAFEGERLIGHAGYYPAELKVEGIPLPVAGIGGVFSDPEFQGKGVATQLVQKCVDESRRKGAALAVLWSDKHDFYQKLGFHLVGRQWTIQMNPSHAPLLRAKGEKCGIKASSLRLEEAEASPSFLAQSFEKLQTYPLGVARSMEDHALLLSTGSCRIFAAWAGNELAAYFLVGKGRDLQNYVHEWAGDEGALHHLAAFCLETLNHPLNILSPQFMPDEVNWIYSLDEMGISLRAERMGLVKLLDFGRVKKLIHSYLAAVGLPPQDLNLEQKGEKYLVQWRKEKPLEFSEGDFLGFIFGPEMPAHQEMRAFLPIRLWYWGMDSV